MINKKISTQKNRNKKQLNYIYICNNQIIMKILSRYCLRPMLVILTNLFMITDWLHDQRMLDPMIDNCGTWMFLQSKPSCQLSRRHLIELDFNDDMSTMIRDWYCVAWKHVGLKLQEWGGGWEWIADLNLNSDKNVDVTLDWPGRTYRCDNKIVEGSIRVKLLEFLWIHCVETGVTPKF